MNPPVLSWLHALIPAFRIPESWRSLAGACVLMLLLGACAGEREPAIRIGISAFPSYELLYLAQEQGYFRDEGVNVRIVEFASLSNTRVALENSQIDGAATTLVDLLLAATRKHTNARVVWVLNASNGSDRIIARAPVGSVKELKGKRVGLEVDSLGLVVLQRALEQHGLALKDVTLIDSDQPEGEAALRAGRIDALVTYAPYSEKLMRDARMRSIFDSTAIPREIIDAVALNHDLIKRRPHDVDRIRRAIQRALDYLRDHEAAALKIMAQREHVTEKEMRASLKNDLLLVDRDGQHAFMRPGGFLESSLATAGRVLREARRVETLPPLADLLPEPAATGLSNVR